MRVEKVISEAKQGAIFELLIFLARFVFYLLSSIEYVMRWYYTAEE
ncbi:MAG: hypothetical protein P4M11_15330 [Candidatus Pacebacteria bacterium]|nr:hypothetical protein [Candidatus Paceibacterota bacterium]